MRKERSQIKNLDQALEAHMRELESFYYPSHPRDAPELSTEDDRALEDGCRRVRRRIGARDSIRFSADQPHQTPHLGADLCLGPANC